METTVKTRFAIVGAAAALFLGGVGTAEAAGSPTQTCREAHPSITGLYAVVCAVYAPADNNDLQKVYWVLKDRTNPHANPDSRFSVDVAINKKIKERVPQSRSYSGIKLELFNARACYDGMCGKWESSTTVPPPS